jgi:hypothetical protein
MVALLRFMLVRQVVLSAIITITTSNALLQYKVKLYRVELSSIVLQHAYPALPPIRTFAPVAIQD